MEEKFFTTEQVASILQVHPFTILKFIKAGKLQGIKIGRVYRIKESAIDAFLEERMTKPNKKVKEVKLKEEKVVNQFPSEKVTEDVKTKTEISNSDHYYII